MKTIHAHIPKGYVPKPISTVPTAAHGVLAGQFAKLAQHHAALAANKPDAANQPLMRPDQVALAVRKGRGAVRQPVIGTPNPVTMA